MDCVRQWTRDLSIFDTDIIMEEYPLITDLAIILVAAGCTSVICRALKLPILVGYLIAGVLTGPYFPLIPDIHDMTSIRTWSEIGVIFLLFALGLEFNFKDLFKVGKTGLISVLCIASGMMVACLGIGAVMGWSTVTSIFMGGIMSISSTMVIVKAFEELKLKGEPFTHIVYGVMVFQDILGIILMVILPMIAATSQEGSILESISTTAMRVTFFLVLWFVGGIFLVPTLLRKLKPMLSDEILLIISLALCLGMVMLADASHLSTALGAFTIGSILGTTTEAHRIETLVTPLKNLFGAIFFVSIGMLVKPAAIWNNLGLLALFFVMIVILNPIFGTLGAFLSGKSLKLSLKAGSCYGQIGEFSFILATLGVSTHVLSDEIYPVIIMVSAITMVTTPYWIKLSEKFIVPISKFLPENKRYRLEEDRRTTQKAPNRRLVLIKHFASETFILSMICLGIISLLDGFVEPLLQGFLITRWDRMSTVFDNLYIVDTPVPLGQFISMCIVIVLTLLALSPFFSALLMHRNKLNRAFLVLLVRGSGEHLFRIMQIVRIVVVLFFLSFALYAHSPFNMYINIGIAFIMFIIVSCFDIMFSGYIRMERQFLFNYNEADVEEEDTFESSESLRSMSNIQAGEWLSSALSVASYRIDEDSPFLDKSLIDLDLRAKNNLFIIRIDRGDENSINIPSGQEKIQLDDTIHIAGSEGSLRALRSAPYHISDKKLHIQPMRQFSHQLQSLRSDASNLRCIQMPIREN